MKTVQLYDDPGSDRNSARYICFADRPILSAAQFVMIDCPSGRQFFGAVTGPNLNFNRNSLGPTDNTAINQAEQVAYGRLNRDVVVRETFHYEIRLLKEIVDGKPSSVRVRPMIHAMARPATDDEIIRLIGLPEITPETQLGTIIDTEVPICISKRVLMYHTLVAGATGYGKTNTIGNLATAAADLGCYVLVFDHKPDYQHTHLANDDGAEQHFRPLSRNVSYWHVGERLEINGRRESAIVVPAKSLNLYMLAATIFHRDNEDLQRDAFHQLLEAHVAEMNGDWSLDTARRWICGMNAKQAPVQQDARTFSAIQRKFQQPSRIPSWVDGHRKTQTEQFFGAADNRDAFEIETLVRPGEATVVRVGASGEGKDYGLLLSLILDKINAAAASHKLACPVLVCIDEAQDIFSAGRSLRAVACDMLNEHVRKGRSKRIGYLFGVQSSASVPDAIMNNLNNRFIHKHNSPDELRAAANAASEEQRRMTATFSPGECLASIHGANGIIHAQMRRSPFKLTKEEL
jgi:hypothetical protein